MDISCWEVTQKNVKAPKTSFKAQFIQKLKAHRFNWNMHSARIMLKIPFAITPSDAEEFVCSTYPKQRTFYINPASIFIS